MIRSQLQGPSPRTGDGWLPTFYYGSICPSSASIIISVWSTARPVQSHVSPHDSHLDHGLQVYFAHRPVRPVRPHPFSISDGLNVNQQEPPPPPPMSFFNAVMQWSEAGNDHSWSAGVSIMIIWQIRQFYRRFSGSIPASVGDITPTWIGPIERSHLPANVTAFRRKLAGNLIKRLLYIKNITGNIKNTTGRQRFVPHNYHQQHRGGNNVNLKNSQ